MKNAPANAWWIAATSDEVGRPPLARTILDTRVVLFRDSSHRVAALRDLCPHKNVSLSLGSVRGDFLRCRYHGWEFGRDGACSNQPCRGSGEAIRACGVRSFPVVEQDGWIWIWMGAAVCTGLPPRYPRDRGYAWFEFENLMKAPLDLILENGLDCSHTGFVHPGLFRSEPKQYVRALMQETPTGLRVETVGESREKQRDSRVFFSKGHAVKHVDEFIFPHTIRVDYLAGRRHFITVLVVTPESDGNCRVYTRIGLKIPYVAKLIAPISKRVVGKVIAQDKVILENQAANIESEGKRSFIFMDADAMSAWLLRMLRTRETEGRQFRSKEVEYKL